MVLDFTDFFLNVTGGITPHLNIYYIAQNGSLYILQTFRKKKQKHQNALAPGRKVAEPQIHKRNAKTTMCEAQELFDDAPREVNDARA
jgi:hypothetical protein